MARPELEWPIPVYVTELRERVVMTFNVPLRALSRRVPGPLVCEPAAGRGLVSLCLSNGRTLKSVGGVPTLASEFNLAELLTPARWQRACSAPLRGSLLLNLWSNRPGIARLAETTLGFPAGAGRQRHALERARYECELDLGFNGGSVEACLPRPFREEWREASVFSSPEAAEGALLHPECYFVPDQDGTVVRAVPVHHYARLTTPVAHQATAPLIATLLGTRPEEVVLDHVFFQKRCTHTWSFPPQRIPTTAPSRRFEPAIREPLRLAA